MTAVFWPASLPYPLQDGFSMQPEDRRIATSTAGTAIFRGFKGDLCVVECSVLLDCVQSEKFEHFERETLVHGTKWFSFPVWYAGRVHWEDCRFKGRPKAGNLVGLHTAYQFTLYVKRRTELMPDCMVQLFACFPPCFFVELQIVLKALLSRISNVTRAKVNAALAEIYED